MSLHTYLRIKAAENMTPAGWGRPGERPTNLGKYTMDELSKMAPEERQKYMPQMPANVISKEEAVKQYGGTLDPAIQRRFSAKFGPNGQDMTNMPIVYSNAARQQQPRQQMPQQLPQGQQMPQQMSQGQQRPRDITQAIQQQ